MGRMFTPAPSRTARAGTTPFSFRTAFAVEAVMCLLSDAVDVIAPLEPLYRALGTLPGFTMVTVTEEALGGTWEALFQDRADLIVGGVEGLPGSYIGQRQGVRIVPWHTPDLVFAVAPDPLLAGKAEPVSQASLDECRPVVVRDSATSHEAISHGFASSATPVCVPNMQHKLIAQREGPGVGLLPRRLAADDLRAGALIELELAEPAPTEPTVLAWRTSQRGKGLSALTEALQNT